MGTSGIAVFQDSVVYILKIYGDFSEFSAVIGAVLSGHCMGMWLSVYVFRLYHWAGLLALD